MDSLRHPGGLELTGNLSENWQEFKQELLELYLVAAGLDSKGDKQKIAFLLHVASKQAIEVLNTFTMTDEEKDSYDAAIAKFEEYCNPKKNETYERYVFNSRTQAQGEPVEQFITELKIKVRTCGFGTLKNSMIRERIVLGVSSQRIRERLLREEDLNLETAIKICTAAEAAQRQIQSLGQEEAAANIIRKPKAPPKQKARDPAKPQGAGSPNLARQPCCNCSTYHKPGACPAYGKACNVCGKVGHFARAKHGRQGYHKKGKKVQMVEAEEEDEEEGTVPFFIDTVTSKPPLVHVYSMESKWVEQLKLGNLNVKFKLDTGAVTNIISEETFKKLVPRPALKKSPITMRAYNGKLIPSFGVCQVTRKHKTETWELYLRWCHRIARHC